jgi:hypothetical protein
VERRVALGHQVAELRGEHQHAPDPGDETDDEKRLGDERVLTEGDLDRVEDLHDHEHEENLIQIDDAAGEPAYTTSSARVEIRAIHSRASSDRPALDVSGSAVLRRAAQPLIDGLGDGLQRVGCALQLLGGPAPHVGRSAVDGVAELVAPQPHHGHARDCAHEKALHLV